MLHALLVLLWQNVHISHAFLIKSNIIKFKAAGGFLALIKRQPIWVRESNNERRSFAPDAENPQNLASKTTTEVKWAADLHFFFRLEMLVRRAESLTRLKSFSFSYFHLIQSTCSTAHFFGFQRQIFLIFCTCYPKLITNSKVNFIKEKWARRGDEKRRISIHQTRFHFRQSRERRANIKKIIDCKHAAQSVNKKFGAHSDFSVAFWHYARRISKVDDVGRRMICVSITRLSWAGMLKCFMALMNVWWVGVIKRSTCLLIASVCCAKHLTFVSWGFFI